MADYPRLLAETTLFAAPTHGEKFFHVGYAFHFYSFMSGHASAFKEAADKVIASHLGDWSNGDALAFPVLTLYRHSVELALKDLVRLGIRTDAYDLDTDTTILGTKSKDCEELGKGSVLIRHELLPLWESVKRLLDQYQEGDEERPHAERLIKQLDALDRDGQTLRYDRDSRTIRLCRERYDAIPECFDIATLRDGMNALFTYLDNWHGYIQEMYSQMLSNFSYEGG